MTKRRRTRVRAAKLELSRTKSKPKPNIEDYSLLLYGRPKVGKTSFAAEFDSPIFLMCEPGGKALSIYQNAVENWEMFKKFVDLVKE